MQLTHKQKSKVTDWLTCSADPFYLLPLFTLSALFHSQTSFIFEQYLKQTRRTIKAWLVDPFQLTLFFIFVSSTLSALFMNSPTYKPTLHPIDFCCELSSTSSCLSEYFLKQQAPTTVTAWHSSNVS